VTVADLNNTQLKPINVSILEQRRYEQDAAKLDTLRQQVVGIFQKKAASDLPIANIYTSQDLVGHGAIITTDGWILTTIAAQPKDLVVMTFDKKILPIKSATQDPLTGAWFIKVDASGLKAVELVDVSHLPLTQAVALVKFLVAPYNLMVSQDNLDSIWYGNNNQGSDFVRSSEKIDYYLKITNNSVGLVFDVNGSLIGLSKNGLVVPVSYLQRAISSLTSNGGKIVRTYLGVNYLSLSEAWGLPDKFTEKKTKGALLMGDVSKKLLAVVDKSPAQVAGLKAGDIIVKVNNEEINEANSLTKLIQDYPPNTEVELTFWRAAVEQKVKFVLGKI
jgi:serine protease Do